MTIAPINSPTQPFAMRLTGLPRLEAPSRPAAAAQVAKARDAQAAAFALAPTAMAALLRAQEQLDAVGDSAGRRQAAQEIDRLIAQMADPAPPPAPPVHLSASEDFALQMLLGARQRLREVYA